MSEVYWQTASLERYDPRPGAPVTPRLRDVMIALPNICRYRGHVPRFWSVAQHSLLVHRLCRKWIPTTPGLGEWCILHDAAEAYIGDIPTPEKHLPENAWYRVQEERILLQLASGLGLPTRWDSVIHDADRRALEIEAQMLWPDGGPLHEYLGDVRPVSAGDQQWFDWLSKLPRGGADLFRGHLIEYFPGRVDDVPRL